MSANPIFDILEQAQGLSTEPEKILKNAGADLMSLILNEQPIGALALLAALPSSVLYAPDKAGFGILYWSCCIDGEISALVIKALYEASPELFSDFLDSSGSYELFFDETKSSRELEQNPIRWCLHSSNHNALRALLSIGVKSNFSDLYEACAKGEGFCAICLFDEAQKREDFPGIFHKTKQYYKSPYAALCDKIEDLSPDLNKKRGASFAQQYFEAQTEKRILEIRAFPGSSSKKDEENKMKRVKKDASESKAKRL